MRTCHIRTHNWYSECLAPQKKKTLIKLESAQTALMKNFFHPLIIFAFWVSDPVSKSMWVCVSLVSSHPSVTAGARSRERNVLIEIPPPFSSIEREFFCLFFFPLLLNIFCSTGLYHWHGSLGRCHVKGKNVWNVCYMSHLPVRPYYLSTHWRIKSF